MDREFWKGKKVFITGHTGFKGSWLSLWLTDSGASVRGFALEPPTIPSMFKHCKVADCMNSIINDIRDFNAVDKSLKDFQPEIVIHMAAQPIVRESYKNPVETYEINVMGTVHLLEAVRKCKSVRAVVIVTTDKCYENREWHWSYRENEPLGGYDPYSNSKGCSELVTSSFRNSYFNPKDYGITHNVAVATARAGNVIGGGDWALDRLIPDFIRAILEKRKIIIRSPYAIRPWQHVLEPLSGYLDLAEKLVSKGAIYADAWNFGPNESDAKSVEWIVKNLCDSWPASVGYEIDMGVHPHEAGYLKLDCSKAKALLGWYPRWSLKTALHKIIEWTEVYNRGDDTAQITRSQIHEYEMTTLEE